MLALISPAKTMQSHARLNVESPILSEPRFREHTEHIIALMQRYSAAELAEIFKTSGSIASELQSRFRVFHDELTPRLAAVDSYDGVVYKHFKEAIEPNYLQERVRISSLLYGLLRPYDLIKPYRMEGFVHLAGSDERVDRFWRDIQTQTLIDDTNSAGGTLLYLASKEEQNAFHWRKVLSAVRVIDIKFLQEKNGKLRQVVIYTKMARGEMLRYMMSHQITDPDHLKQFEWSGYRYNDQLSTPNEWVWLMN